MATNSLTDEQLVEAARNSNHQLYGEIIKRYQLKLSHYLKKFISDADELQDVLQNVFIKAYKNLYSFNVSKKFSPWIYRIAHNEAINYIRKNSKYAISLDESDFDVADEKMELGRELENTLTNKRLADSIRKLKEKYREPLILFFFEEKSYEEIGDILKLPTSTVGTYISRGKKQLKEFLEK
jgi:RNA polymerase sigma-70 factor, ECF subfamily